MGETLPAVPAWSFPTTASGQPVSSLLMPCPCAQQDAPLAQDMGHTAGSHPPSSSGLGKMTGLERVKEIGFGLAPSPTAPISVSGDTSPVPGLLSGGHAQKLLRAERKGHVSQSSCTHRNGASTRLCPATSAWSPGPQLSPQGELQRI